MLIKLVVAVIILSLAIAFAAHRSHGADDGWHDIPCGESPLKQPDTYDGPIQCRRGPTQGADIGNGPSGQCGGRGYMLFYGRAVEGAEASLPAVWIGTYIVEHNTSRCQLRMASGKDAETGIHSIGAAWAGGHAWMPMRRIEGGDAVQFASKEGHRCVGFLKWWRLNVVYVYGVYCDPEEPVPADQSYTDDEIKLRVAVARLDD